MAAVSEVFDAVAADLGGLDGHWPADLTAATADDSDWRTGAEQDSGWKTGDVEDDSDWLAGPEAG